MTTNLKVLALAALAFALPGCPNESGNQQAGGDQNGGGADPNGFASEAAARPDPRATPRGVVPDVGAGYPTAQFLPRGNDGDLTLAQIKNMRDSLVTYNQRLTMMESPAVARIGIRAMLKGRASVVTGGFNALAAWSMRLFPRQAQAAFSELAMRE